MKILVLATDIYTRGGIARYTDSLARALGALVGRENVHVLPLLGDARPVCYHSEYVTLPATTAKLTRKEKIRHFWRAIRQSSQGYGVVFCSHLGLGPVAACGKLLFGAPYFIVCHGVEAWERLPRLKRLALRGADLLLPISRFTAEKLCAVNEVDPSKIRIVYNTIPDSFVELLSSGRAKGQPRSVLGGGKCLLSVGSLSEMHRYKGFDLVIRALPSILGQVPTVRYVIVGSGSDRMRLERIVQETNVADRVVFAGEVTDEQLAGYYRACDVFVLPSRAVERGGHWDGEGFGRVYIEAALAGKPVIGSRGGGAAEAVVHGQTGILVDPSSEGAIASAVVELLQTPGLADRMGSAGQKWANDNFTSAAAKASLARILDEYKSQKGSP